MMAWLYIKMAAGLAQQHNKNFHGKILKSAAQMVYLLYKV